jgi:hypothetical protein
MDALKTIAGYVSRSQEMEALTDFSRTDRTAPDHGVYPGHRARR